MMISLTSRIVEGAEGAVGTIAAIAVTKLEDEEKPILFLASSLMIYVFPVIKPVRVYDLVKIPEATTM